MTSPALGQATRMRGAKLRPGGQIAGSRSAQLALNLMF